MILLALTLGCDPLGPGPYDPDTLPPTGSGILSVEPARLDFGEFNCLTDSPTTRALRVTNRGGGELVVAGLNLVVGSAAFTTDAPALVRLAPDEGMDVRVTFAPDADGLYGAELVPNGAVRIGLEGHALAPRARLLDEQLDLGATRVGCESAGEVLLLNEGSLPLTLGEPVSGGSSRFSLTGTPPSSLEPGEEHRFQFVFAPLDGGSQEATLSFATNDPSTPDLVLGLSGLGVPGGRVVERYEFAPILQADLLFVLDASAPMEPTLAAAREASPSLFQALDAEDLDWHVAATHPAIDCYSTDAPFLDPGLFPRYSPEEAAAALSAGLETLGESVSPSLLEHAAAVLERTGPLECLDGFLRENARLHVVFVAGSPDSSPQATSAYVDRLRARVSGEEQLLISAITGDGRLCADGGAVREAAAMTGGPVLDPCALSWEEIFAQIALDSASGSEGRAIYPLAELPVPDTILVRSGAAELQGWRYEADTNSVILEGGRDGLNPGDPIEIEYLEAIACEG